MTITFPDWAIYDGDPFDSTRYGEWRGTPCRGCNFARWYHRANLLGASHGMTYWLVCAAFDDPTPPPPPRPAAVPPMPLLPSDTIQFQAVLPAGEPATDDGDESGVNGVEYRRVQ